MKYIQPTRDLLFTKSFHLKLKSNVEKNYLEFIDDIREDLTKGFSTDIIDPQFLDQLNDIVHDVSFDHYSPLKFYWMNLVDNLIYLIQLHEEILDADEFNENNEELSETEEELFALWNETELAQIFLDTLAEGLPVLEASDQLLPLIENQIISFYVLHINQFQQEFDDAIIYQAVHELGDFSKRLYIGDNHHMVDIHLHSETFPSLPLKSFLPHKNEIVFEIKEDDQKFKIRENTNFLQIDDVKLYVIPSCDEGIKKHGKFIENIELALKRIKLAAPHIFETFKSFTNTIVPINENGIVSYSMQSLPGYSSINMFNRDEIDLMDDLIHENGHHYLNTYLNHLDLIDEDDSKIYFSPWRKALRPIRGIYHATFTFYWAFELFFWLNQAVEDKKIKFTQAQVIKIQIRFLEEYYMLNYCMPDLKHAFKNKKITKTGNDLILDIFKRISSYSAAVTSIETGLKNTSKSQYDHIQSLKADLKKARELNKIIE